MLEVTVNKEKDESNAFQAGNLVEFSHDGTVVLITDWMPDDNKPNSFAGVALYVEVDLTLAKLGEYAIDWNKCMLKKFIGSLTLKQS